MAAWSDLRQPKPLNLTAFVQTPMYFRTNEDPETGEFLPEVRGMEGGDPAGHGNKTFFDGHQHGRDGCVSFQKISCSHLGLWSQFACKWKRVFLRARVV